VTRSSTMVSGVMSPAPASGGRLARPARPADPGEPSASMAPATPAGPVSPLGGTRTRNAPESRWRSSASCRARGAGKRGPPRARLRRAPRLRGLLHRHRRAPRACHPGGGRSRRPGEAALSVAEIGER
jgi:hypothetical protein